MLEEIRKEGFVRVRVDGEMHEVTDEIPLDRYKQHTIEVVVDRLVVKRRHREPARRLDRDGAEDGQGHPGIL